MSFLSVDHVSAEDHFFTIAAAYDTGETLCTTEARCNAETNFRLTEFSVFSSITEVASASEFAAAAESVAVDSSDDRLGRFSMRVKVSWEILPNLRPSTGFLVDISTMSAPATKDLAPSPVMITTLTDSSASIYQRNHSVP